MNTSRFRANSKKTGALIASLLLLGLGIIGCNEVIDDEETSPGGIGESLHVEPELYEDAMGDTCRDAGIALGIENAETWIDCKIDDPPSGENIYTDPGDFDETPTSASAEECAELLEIWMDIYDTERGEEMDWESLNDQPIVAVLVKGGPDANLYVYDPPETFDEGLHAPPPPGAAETWADISHVSFCIGEPVVPPDLELTVSKTVDATAERVRQWEIDKEVDPDLHEIFQVNGIWPTDPAISEYVVTVDTTGFADAFAVSGTITIENLTDEDAEIAAVTDVVNGVDAIVDCGEISFDPFYLLEAGETLLCDYIATGLTGEEDTNTATVIVTAESLVDGGVAVEPIVFPSPQDDLEIVTVVDEFDGDEETLGTCAAANAPCEFIYEREFFCPGDEGNHENIATIVETGDFDTAEVVVVCIEVDPPPPPKDPKPKPPKDEKPPKDGEPIVDDPTPPKDEKPKPPKGDDVY